MYMSSYLELGGVVSLLAVDGPVGVVVRKLFDPLTAKRVDHTSGGQLWRQCTNITCQWTNSIFKLYKQ